MSVMVTAELRAGVIYGDAQNREYVYMPASEIGVAEPLCVLENQAGRKDVTLQEAVALVRRLSLKPTRHPLLGTHSC